MTHPDEKSTSDETTEGAGEAGALAAASRDEEGTGDPLGPLNAVTENDES